MIPTKDNPFEFRADGYTVQLWVNTDTNRINAAAKSPLDTKWVNWSEDPVLLTLAACEGLLQLFGHGWPLPNSKPARMMQLEIATGVEMARKLCTETLHGTPPMGTIMTVAFAAYEQSKHIAAYRARIEELEKNL